MQQIVIIIVLIILVLVVIGIVAAVILNKEAERKKRALNVITGQSTGLEKRENAEDLQHKRRAEIAKKLKDTKAEEGKINKKATIGMLIAQAGLSMSLIQFWIMSVVCTVLCFFLAKMLGQSLPIVIMATVIGFFGLPRFILKKMAAGRQKKFLEEFPDALEATVRLLKAGMPVSEAIAMISKEFEGPVGEEMSIIYDKQKIGIPMHEAALECTYRMPLPEMQMFATGLSIQSQTGSSLSEVLTNLSNVIRSRFRLKRKIKALSSEAVASASIIASLPVVVAFGVYIFNRKYIEVLFYDPFGQMLLTGAIFWMGVGVFIMKQMINFKI